MADLSAVVLLRLGRMDEFEKRMLDVGRAVRKSGEPRFSRFLEPPEQSIAQRAAHEAGVECQTYGGYDEAERRVAGLSQDGEIESWDWPVACLRLSWNAKFASAGHRDVLGAVMGLGLERATIGDIQMGDGCAYLFALREVVSYVTANLDSAGRAKLKVDEIDASEAEIAPPIGVTRRITLASMRLDALVAEGYDLSRGDAQALIKRGLVKLNHVECLKGDKVVVEGDLVSARGYGRMKLVEQQGETKKGRTGAVVFRYGDLK